MIRVKKLLKFVGLVLLALAINILPMKLIALQESTSVVFHWISSISYLVLASLVVFLVWKKYWKTQSEETRKLRFTWRDFGIAFLFYLGTRLLAIVGTILIQVVTGNMTSANDAALFATQEQLATMFPLYFVAFHMAIGVFAPIMEELVFRGFFSHYFFKHHSKWLRLVVSSTLFALLHIAYSIEFVIYFGLGTLFYLSYARRGNILDSIVVHILNNCLLVILSVVTYIVLMLT